MPQGLEVYDASGALVFGTGYRGYRVLTVIAAGGIDGSQTVAALSGQTAAVEVLPADTDKDQPIPSVTGATVSWAYGTRTGLKDAGSKLNVAVF